MGTLKLESILRFSKAARKLKSCVVKKVGFLKSNGFRDIFSTLPTAVSILTVSNAVSVQGVTISSLQSAQISDSEQLLLFVLKKDSKFGELISEQRPFVVNVLSESQEDLAQRYSQDRSPDIIDTFENRGGLLIKSLPIIKGARYSLSAQFHRKIELEINAIFLVTVKELVYSNPGNLLVYRNRKFGRLEI